MPNPLIIARKEGEEVNSLYASASSAALGLYNWLTDRLTKPFYTDSEVDEFNARASRLEGLYSQLDNLEAKAVGINARLDKYGNQYAEGVPLVSITDWSVGNPNAAPELRMVSRSVVPFFAIATGLYFFFIKGKKR